MNHIYFEESSNDGTNYGLHNFTFNFQVLSIKTAQLILTCGFEFWNVLIVAVLLLNRLHLRLHVRQLLLREIIVGL